MYRNSKHTVIFPLILSAGVVLGILLGQYLGRHDTASQIRGMLSHMSVPSNKLTYTLSLIENRYVDSVSMDSLAEHVIPLLVRELDPHSVYIPASEMAALNEPLEGEFNGIGVVFNMATDTVIVLNVIPHGPSDKAGVKAGDRIVEIGDSLVAGRKIPQNEVVKMLRGPRGSKVRLGLGRQGIDGLVEVEVERGIIPIRSVESAFRIVDGIGYVKLGQFARTTAGEFRAALDTLRAQGVSKLIFDLRGNSGGFLDQAIAVANEFLHEGQLIVYTEDRRHEQLREYADGTGSAQEMEVAVLIDEASASSSEILAGALQDNDRGTIIGRRSYGKGLVQSQIPFPDGSAVRLTVARYYTPTGRSIQKPYSDGTESYNRELLSRYEHNELFSADSIHFADSLKYVTEGGKVVYGGGGIMPDIFVPADTSDMTPYFREVAGRNILYRFTLDYTDRHRAQLNGIRTLEELDRFFGSQPDLLGEFVRYAARQGVAPKPAEIERSKEVMLAQIKAYVGRNTPLEDNAFYHNIQSIDNVVKQALEVLSAPRPDNELHVRDTVARTEPSL